MKRFVLVLSIVILFAVPSTVLADIAPPQNPPGSNLDPGVKHTQVRMQAETVILNVQKDLTPGSLGNAHVTADFTMQNLGTESESLAVRFPIAVNNGFDNSFPEITNIGIRVNNSPVSFRRANYPASFGGFNEDSIPWAEFPVTFPVGKEVAIRVAYDLKGTGYLHDAFTTFSYTLQTGAGWKATIGSADIILRLPYPASTQNVLLGYADYPKEEDATFQGNEVRWHFENFEPGFRGLVSDLEFDLVAPAVWQTVVTELENVTKNSNDGEAWGRLARAYKTAMIPSKLVWRGTLVRSDPGGEELYQLSLSAYQKCLALLPEDALWHAGFAELLAIHAYATRNNEEADQANKEINTALQLAPYHPVVLKSSYNVQSILKDGSMQTGFESNLPFPGPTQEIPPPMFNLAAIPGTYQIDNVTFYGKTVQLKFKFRSDFSATMETKFEDGEVYTASGTWKPGDIFFDVSLVDQFQEPMKFNIYVAGPAADDLTISNVASAYSFDNIPDATLINVSNGAPAPTITPVATDTPAQTSQPRPTNTFEPSRTPPPTFPPLATKTSRPTQTIQPTANSAVPASAPKTASPICGSAILLPLLGAIWLSWKRRTAW